MAPIERRLAVGAVLLFVIAGACGRPADDQALPASPAAGREPSSTAAVSPSPSILPAASATPTGSPRVEASSVVLDVAIGPAYEQPAAKAPRVGGSEQRGPLSVAVDREGRVYLWDFVRVRILVYEGARLARVVPVPFVDPAAAGLLAYGGRLYLRFGAGNQVVAEYEIDAATGELLRVGKDLYPRGRSALTRSLDKGPVPSMGGDLLGNTYQHERITHGYQVRRLDASGAVVAVGSYATEDLAFDSYVTGDGSVYDLRQAFSGGTPQRVRIVKVLGPAGPAPPETVPAVIGGPRFVGRDAPSTVEVVAAPALPPATLTGPDATAMWWLLSLSWTEPAIATFPTPGNEAVRLTARWIDGSSLAIAFNGTVLDAGTTRLRTSALAQRSLPHILSRPVYSIDALRRFGGRIRIPDVVNVERELTRGEIDSFADALGAAYLTTYDEHHPLLEAPFPRRQVVVAYPAGRFVLQESGERHLLAEVGDGLAMFHDGRASTLLRQWLPTPSFARDDPAILYTAEKVTLPDTNISHWKTSIVRALVLPATGPAQGVWDAQGPLVFTFTLPGGRTEVVRVDGKGYTFAGRTYERLGLLDLHGLKGVP